MFMKPIIITGFIYKIEYIHIYVFVICASVIMSVGNPWFSTHAHAHTHREREKCSYLKSLRPSKWYKCHTQCLWSDQWTAHQQSTVILITRLLLWPLPPVYQTLTCGEKRFNGNDGKDGDKKRDKDQTNMTHLWIGPPIYPGVQGLCAGFVSTSINGKQKKRSKKRTGTSEISRRAILQNDETEGRDAAGTDECIEPAWKEETKDLAGCFQYSLKEEQLKYCVDCGSFY